MLDFHTQETEFSDESAQLVLRMIRLGNVPAAFCQILGLDAGAADRWAHENAQFAADYEKAKMIGADAMINECVAIADRIDLKADAKKVMIDARQKCAAQWYPSKYGPQADKTPTGGIQALVKMDYHKLDAAKKAAVDKFFGTDDDDD